MLRKRRECLAGCFKPRPRSTSRLPLRPCIALRQLRRRRFSHA